jgi:hypothetical protein
MSKLTAPASNKLLGELAIANGAAIVAGALAPVLFPDMNTRQHLQDWLVFMLVLNLSFLAITVVIKLVVLPLVRRRHRRPQNSYASLSSK